MHPRTHTLLFSFLPLLFVVPATAQLHSGGGIARGSGTIQGCDTSMHVGFNTTHLANYQLAFEPIVVEGNNVAQDSQWNFYNGSWGVAYGSPTLTFPGQQAWPVCLTVNAYDLLAAQPCSTTYCQLVTPYVDPNCAQLVADFTIASVEDSTITFLDQSSFIAGISSSFWNFGDGATLQGPSSTHAFTGPGPFEVCLTVVGPAPSYCTTTRCQWLYLGPGNVECPTLVQHDFVMLQSSNLVGVLDTSNVSGMNSSVGWDFGDGATATGIVAVHEYQDAGEFNICGTLRVWGPLLADTCVSTICRSVFAMPVSAVEEQGVEPALLVHPNPCADRLFVDLPIVGPSSGVLVDALGRPVLSFASRSSPLVLDLSALPDGVYTLQVRLAEGVRSARMVKSASDR